MYPSLQAARRLWNKQVQGFVLTDGANNVENYVWILEVERNSIPHGTIYIYMNYN